MNVQDLIASAFATVTQRRYEVARASNPGLEPYPTARDVTEVLRDRRASGGLEVARILVCGFHAGAREVFGPLLLRGFEFMLRHLRVELVWTPMAPEDLDQVVVTAFLEAADRVSPRKVGGMLITRLRQLTRQRALGAASAALSFEARRLEPSDQARPGVHDRNDDRGSVDPWDLWSARAGRAADDELWRHVRATEVSEVLGSRLSASTRHVLSLLSTMPDASLPEYVERTATGSRQQQRAKYWELKKREQRARAELREIFGTAESRVEEGAA